MTDHQITFAGAIVSAIALAISYLAYWDTKKKNRDEKVVKLRVAVGRINELIRPFKKLKITKIELLTQDNLEHDSKILESFVEKLKSYRDDLAEFPEVISNNVFSLEASAIKIMELNLADLNAKIENYLYDKALHGFSHLYLHAWLISDYICKTVLPSYIIPEDENSTYFFQNYTYYKELTAIRADQRSMFLQADMVKVKIILEEINKSSEPNNF